VIGFDYHGLRAIMSNASNAGSGKRYYVANMNRAPRQPEIIDEIRCAAKEIADLYEVPSSRIRHEAEDGRESETGLDFSRK